MRTTIKKLPLGVYEVPLLPAPEVRVKSSYLIVDKEFPQSRGMSDEEFFEALKVSVVKHFDA